MGSWPQVPGGGPVLCLIGAWVRAMILVTTVGVALLGALTGPVQVTAVGAPLGGAVALAAVWLATWGLDLHRPAPRTVAVAATTGALVVPTALGLGLLGSAGTALLAALLLIGPVRPSAAPLSRAGAPSPPDAGAGARPPSAPGARSAPAPRR